MVILTASGPGVATAAASVAVAAGGVEAVEGAGLQFNAVGVWAEADGPSESAGVRMSASKTTASATNRERLFGRIETIPPGAGPNTHGPSNASRIARSRWAGRTNGKSTNTEAVCEVLNERR